MVLLHAIVCHSSYCSYRFHIITQISRCRRGLGSNWIVSIIKTLIFKITFIHNFLCITKHQGCLFVPNICSKRSWLFRHVARNSHSVELLHIFDVRLRHWFAFGFIARSSNHTSKRGCLFLHREHHHAKNLLVFVLAMACLFLHCHRHAEQKLGTG